LEQHTSDDDSHGGGDDDDDDDDVDDDNDASGVVWDANDDCDDTIGIVVMTNVNEMLHLYDDDWNDSSGDMMGNTIHNNLNLMVGYSVFDASSSSLLNKP